MTYDNVFFMALNFGTTTTLLMTIELDTPPHP